MDLFFRDIYYLVLKSLQFNCKMSVAGDMQRLKLWLLLKLFWFIQKTTNWPNCVSQYCCRIKNQICAVVLNICNPITAVLIYGIIPDIVLWERPVSLDGNGWPGLLYRLLKAVMWPDLPEIFRVSLNLGTYQHTAWGQLWFGPEKGHLGLVWNWKPMALLCLCYKWVWNRLQLCVDSWEDEKHPPSSGKLTPSLTFA